MALPRFNDDIEYIQKLADEPNDVGGYTAAELKAEFDKAGLAIQGFINNTLIPYLEGIYGAENIGIQPVGGLIGVADLQSALEKIEEQMAEMSQGAVADYSIGTAKLINNAVTEEKLADGAVGSEKLSDGAVLTRAIAALSVTTEKLAQLCVTAEKIAEKAVETGKLADKAVTTGKIGDKAVGAGQLDDLSVTESKLFAGAVTSGKIAIGAVNSNALAEEAVTRAKLASDALYGNRKYTSASRDITSDDGGATLVIGNATGVILTVPASISVPNLFAFTVISYYTKTVDVTFPNSWYINVMGDNRYNGGTFRVPAYGMATFIYLTDNQWVASGMAEKV